MTNSPLKVLIIGGGIGGLTAAIGLRQQGHETHVFEKSEFLREFGAAMHLSPNCTALLNRFGIDPGTIGGTPLRKFNFFDTSGDLILDVGVEESRKHWQAGYFLIHRVDLHNELKRKATAADDNTPPVRLHTAAAVNHVDCEAATLTLSDGRKVSGDVIIAADGLHSKSREVVAGDSFQPFPTGKSCYRYLTDISEIRKDPATAEFVEHPGTVVEIIGDDRSIILYPCSNDKSLYTGVFVPTSETGPTQEGWGRAADKKKLLSSFSAFPLKAQALLEKASEDSLKIWDLLDCPEVKRWTRGRTMLLGDAAHPFLPYMGQGAAMAIEDAASISALLERGTSTEEVPGLLELFQKCRKDRVDRILDFTRKRGRNRSGNQGPYPSADEIAQFSQYCIGHNEWESTMELAKAQSADMKS